MDLHLPRHFATNAISVSARFETADYGHLRRIVKGYVNQMCGETPTDLRMGVPPR
jgi:hypothetical protein